MSGINTTKQPRSANGAPPTTHGQPPVPRSHYGPSGALVRAGTARTFAWIGLIIWALVAVLPMIWLLIAATKSGLQLSSKAPFSIGSLETVRDSWSNLEGFNNGVIFRWLGNTVILTVAQIVLTVVATIPAGYALGACQFRLRKPILILTLGLILLPGGALVLPLYLEMLALGLVGNRLAVILPGGFFPLGLYLSFIYFSTTIGKDVYDAARLDGCSEWKVFVRIAMPLAAPMVALVTFFSFVRNWGEFLLPYIMLQTDQYPLPVGLAILAAASPELNPGLGFRSDVGIAEVILATLLTMTPVLLVLIFAQRVILRGATMLSGGFR